ncbi:mediator of RNA polymerase II transcription subunit 24 [Elysia marginata]|uniref:Mediator of RNA polymerase II transcription subunit 24 n=1 Tax=Elysia marginata TaxID=1093978 RepID=A0AAV4H9Q9_9GAST|nr:mediator of RNA polymerase II transcription subunit 24 [Elysia marginata]
MTSCKAQLASKVKLTLMQAWRERWTEIQWAIELKKLLAAYSGESVDIAEILMQQALVGSSPNQLILSYLKHSVLSLRLSDFRQSMMAQESRQSMMTQEYFEIMDNSSRSIVSILERKPVKGLLQIARMDSPEDYRDFEQSEMNARGIMSQIPLSTMSDEAREKISSALTLLSKLEEQEICNEAVLEVIHAPIIPTINGLVALEAVLNTSSDIQPFVDQVLMISRLMKLSMSQLCLEIFRACFMGFMDTCDFSEDLQWATFTLLKVPRILNNMKQQMSNWEMNYDVERGLNMLLEYTHLLDQTDIKHSCDMMGQFITELQKAKVLSEDQKNTFSQKRMEQRSLLRQSDISGSNESKSFTRVTQAESTVSNILKSLDSDPIRNSDQMVKVLTIMLQGHSFDVLRLGAASAGQLHDFMSKLIRINELASHTQASNDTVRLSQWSQLFDVTFLMVVSTFQQHGLEIALPSRENEASVVVQWAQLWLPENGKYKNCELVTGEEQDKVDYILKLMLSKAEITPCGPIQSYKELIKYLPYALQEVIYAMEHLSISMEQVKDIIDNICKQNMKCFILVCITYLCSYMNMVGAHAREKPLLMLEMLIAPQGIDMKQIMQTIVDNIVFDILPEGHAQRPVRRYLLSSKETNSRAISETLRLSFNRGWLNLESIHKLDQLLSIRGPDWFCWEMVEHILTNSHIEDSSQSLSLAVAIVHLDLERLTVSLVRRLLPRLLATPDSGPLADPKGYCLAKLCVLCITAKVGQKEPYVRRFHRGVTDGDLDMDQDEIEPQPAKLRKMSEPQLTLSLEEFNLDAIADKEDGEGLPSYDVKEPLNKALVNLFSMMSTILTANKLTPRTWFIVSFLKEVIRCGGQHTRFIMQFMPHNMLNQVMRALPGIFSDEEILRICDLTTVTGRKNAAKAITVNSVTPPLDILNWS